MSDISTWLPEQLKTIANLCQVADILYKQNLHHLLPTILEKMLEEVQAIVDENCVLREDNG